MMIRNVWYNLAMDIPMDITGSLVQVNVNGVATDVTRMDSST